MEALKAQRIMLSRQPLSELLPYLSYEEKRGLYVLDQGIGFVFECSPLLFAGAETAQMMRGLFESFLPPGNTDNRAKELSKRLYPFTAKGA